MVTLEQVKEVFGGSAVSTVGLSLESTKNISGKLGGRRASSWVKEVGERCERVRTWFQVHVRYHDGNEEVKRVFGRCKKWDCPYCAKMNARVLRNKLTRGIEGLLRREIRNGFQVTYFVKLLTLTLPGASYRERTSAQDSGKDLVRSFKRLVDQLRREIGSFGYCRVREFHESGYPHLHVVLVGRAIGPKEVLPRIRRIWCNSLGMGNIDLKSCPGGARHVANYLAKYVTKGLEAGEKWSKVYTMSQDMNQAASVDRPIITLLARGTYTEDEGKICFHAIYECPEYLEFTSEEAREEVLDWWYQHPLPFTPNTSNHVPRGTEVDSKELLSSKKQVKGGGLR